MRQILFAVFITVTIVGSIAEYSLAQVLPGLDTTLQNPLLPEDALQNIDPGHDTTLKERMWEQLHPRKIEKNSHEMARYKCIEHCALVRQSCEAFATVQPDLKKSIIGLKENYEWSRECQKVYSSCQDKCTINQNAVHWKRLHAIKEKKDESAEKQE